MNAIVIERNGRATYGELLYLYFYPYAVHRADGAVERFEARPQRVGLLTEAGNTWHFTVPFEVRHVA